MLSSMTIEGFNEKGKRWEMGGDEGNEGNDN
jgi:hypothetical protein